MYEYVGTRRGSVLGPELPGREGAVGFGAYLATSGSYRGGNHRGEQYEKYDWMMSMKGHKSSNPPRISRDERD